MPSPARTIAASHDAKCVHLVVNQALLSNASLDDPKMRSE